MNSFRSKLTFGLGLLVAAPAFASTINIDFGKPTSPFTQDVSTTANYTFAPGLQISATGYHIVNSTTVNTIALHAKTAGGDEEGLGLAQPAGGSSYEITFSNFIQLDLTKLITAGATSFSLFTDSTTGQDAYAISLATTKGTLGTLFATGNTEKTFTFTAAQIAATPYISLGATAGDVLLGPGTITTAPEPGTILSLGAGLILVGLRFKKRARA